MNKIVILNDCMLSFSEPIDEIIDSLAEKGILNYTIIETPLDIDNFLDLRQMF